MDSASVVGWRALHHIKQSALADMLGVSQAAVSKWETGQAKPSRKMALRMAGLMHSVHNSELAYETARVRMNAQPIGIARGKDLQVVAFSAGHQSVWPELSSIVGNNLRPLLLNEARAYIEDQNLFDDAISGEILMMTGVSQTVIGLGSVAPPQTRLRWHIAVRRIGGELIHEMGFAPDENEAVVGIHKILRRSDVASDFE